MTQPNQDAGEELLNWKAEPEQPGFYWMNYVSRTTFQFVTAIVEIRPPDGCSIDGRKRCEGLWWNGLHYWREQFEKALYKPLDWPTEPDRWAAAAPGEGKGQ